MNIIDLQTKLEGYISSGAAEKCLDELKIQLRIDEADIKLNVLMLQNQFAQFHENFIKGMVGDTEKNVLTARVLFLISDFIRSRREEIFSEKILVVAHSEKAWEKISKYFNPDFFNKENIQKAINEFKPELAVGQDFILFDTFHMDSADTSYSRTMLKKYLEERKVRVLMMFGPHDPGLSDTLDLFRDKFFAANSPFSLYARIRELREYLKIHGAPKQTRFD